MEGPPPVKRASDKVDLFRALPVEMLHQIMSFLNARQAVQTSLLLPQWRDLWRTMPSVNADFNEFKHIRCGVHSDCDGDVAFNRFIDRLLDLRDPNAKIETFWLRYSISDRMPASSKIANSWISHALEKKAQVLEVVISHFPLKLDHSKFTSSSLRRIGFSFVYLYQGFFKQLQDGCPELQELLLHECMIADDKIISQSEKLKVLAIYGVQSNKFISTPSVNSLTLSTHEGHLPILEGMELLGTASVSITYRPCNYGVHANDLHQYLPSLSGVTNLQFNYQCTDMDQLRVDDPMLNYHGTELCPKFINLVNLTFGISYDFYTLAVFLENSPRLENLTLKLAKCTSGKSEIRGISKGSNHLVCEHLKIVEVICCEDDPRVTKVKDFFLNNGMTTVQIRIKHRSQGQNELPAFIRHEER